MRDEKLPGKPARKQQVNVQQNQRVPVMN
jgi:hypothetical protein